MSNRLRLLTAIILITLIGLPTLALTIAQPPADPPKTLELPDLPDLAFPKQRSDQDLDLRIQQKLREAIEKGDFSQTGDPEVDDVLQLLQRQGSILENSILGPPATNENPAGQQIQSASAKARAAECLLKAARVLEKIDPADESRRDLVNQMRRESVRLLRE